MWVWIIDIVILLAIVAWYLYPRWRLRRVAKVLDNQAFNQKISENGQLIDVREPGEYRKKHIMGARNLPYTQIDQSLSALTKSKAVLLYENGRPSNSTKVAGKLKKSGFTDVYILREGLSKWGGKVKES